MLAKFTCKRCGNSKSALRRERQGLALIDLMVGNVFGFSWRPSPLPGMASLFVELGGVLVWEPGDSGRIGGGFKNPLNRRTYAWHVRNM